MLRRPTLYLAILASIGILMLLSFVAWCDVPVKPGNPSEFLGDIGRKIGDSKWGLIYIVDGERILYASNSPLGDESDSPYRTISVSQVQAVYDDMPNFYFSARPKDYIDRDDFAHPAWEKWVATPGNHGGVCPLIAAIETRRDEWLRIHDPGHAAYPCAFDAALNTSPRPCLYRWSFLFESIWFAGLTWFGLWPWIRRSGRNRKLLHFSALPFLLYLPMWFGYCKFAVPAYPGGGIIYAYFCRPNVSLLPNFEWEHRFLAALPSPLTAITQGREMLYSDYPAIGQAIPDQFGPISVMLISLLFFAALGAVYVAAWAVSTYRQSRLARPGFPVEPTSQRNG